MKQYVSTNARLDITEPISDAVVTTNGLKTKKFENLCKKIYEIFGEETLMQLIVHICILEKFDVIQFVSNINDDFNDFLYKVHNFKITSRKNL